MSESKDHPEPVDLDRLKELHDATTPVWWQYCPKGDGCGGTVVWHRNDAALIVALHNAFPALHKELTAARRVIRALERCESNRGRFSCCERHDGRCPALYANPMPCQCGADELEAALAAIPQPQGEQP